jgi:hypothetical protein
MLRDKTSKIGAIVPEFNWAKARHAFKGFGGDPSALQVDKTGMPFYDALRLYGAIDLYIGTRGDVLIHDVGDRWKVYGRSRRERVRGRDIAAFKAVHNKKTPTGDEFCERLRQAIIAGARIPRTEDPEQGVPTDSQGRVLDPALQSGIRGLSAAEYDSMNSTSKFQCKATIPLSDALIAYAGLRRTEGIGEIQFLPIFEGEIDLGKIVSPLHAWLAVPNPLCAQVLMLLSLKTALWSEGYEKRLSGVVYSKKTQRTSFNYSGIIRIDSTAVGQIDDAEFCGLLHRVFRRMLRISWKNKKATLMAPHALAVAEWLMQPRPGSLRGMITAQEFLLKSGEPPFLVIRDNVRKVFEMTYPDRKIDYEAVRQLAKTASSAIYNLGPKEDEGKRRKHWYNEVVALRNSPNKESFRHRVLTIIEQGRAENSWVEAFDPASLLDSMGEDRPSFEEFRDCFRMYLIQESAPKRKQILDVDVESRESAEDEVEGEEQGS